MRPPELVFSEHVKKDLTKRLRRCHLLINGYFCKYLPVCNCSRNIFDSSTVLKFVNCTPKALVSLEGTGCSSACFIGTGKDRTDLRTDGSRWVEPNWQLKKLPPIMTLPSSWGVVSASLLLHTLRLKDEKSDVRRVLLKGRSVCNDGWCGSLRFLGGEGSWVADCFNLGWFCVRCEWGCVSSELFPINLKGFEL